MTLAAKDRKALLPKLDRLVGAIEDLLLSGLTTASESTRKALGVTFQEASRMRLLRLGGTLRVANEELGRSEPVGEVDLDRVNVNGGSISVGHPFGMTGARMSGQVLLEGRRRRAKLGVVTICI